MITADNIMSIDKDQLPEAAKAAQTSDLPVLVDLLSEKNDKIRYQAFLLLTYRSQFFDDVYPFWETFRLKMKSSNSYQRSIGLMLIAENAKWDAENKLEHSVDEYLNLLTDEKPITVRQCIQSLSSIVPYKPNLYSKIVGALLSVDIASVKETMRKSILLDILNILISIKKRYHTDEIDNFILKALSGEILDKKSKKEIEAQLILNRATEAT